MIRSTTLLLRHLPTLEDAQDLYSSPDSLSAPCGTAPEILASLRAEVAAFRERVGINRVICADNGRCVSTAELLFGRGTSVEPTPLLRNIHIAEWVGLSEAAAESRYPELYKQWYTEPDTVVFCNGDSLARIQSRLCELFRSIDEPCAIITHTTPFQLLVCATLGLSPNHIWRMKPEFHTFSVLGRDIVWALNAATLGGITLRT